MNVCFTLIFGSQWSEETCSFGIHFIEGLMIESFGTKDHLINPENSKDSFWIRMFGAQHVAFWCKTTDFSSLRKHVPPFFVSSQDTNQEFMITLALVSKDSRRYTYSHQKQGENQTPSFSSIMPHVNYICIHYFYCVKVFPGGNVHCDAWGFLGQLGFSSLNLELALWQDRFFASTWTYQAPDPVINGIITTHICGFMGFSWRSNNPTE